MVGLVEGKVQNRGYVKIVRCLKILAIQRLVC